MSRHGRSVVRAMRQADETKVRQESDGTRPLISIGMPVYNGERTIRRAIDALLAQTLPDFELIISDNASDDATEEICLGYARSDPRVRYLRNPRNIGASRNFNRVFELARGKYFKWAAHDDWVAPEFLARCVSSLEAHPDAALCWAGAVFVDEEEKPTDSQPLRADPELLTAESPQRRRFRQALYVHPGPPLFGVIRPEVLTRTGLMRPIIGGDRVLVAELSLLAGFCWVAEPLMYYTHYPNERVGYYSAQWWNPGLRRPRLLRGIPRQGLHCAATVLRWGTGPATTAALLSDVGRKYGRLTLRRVGWLARTSLTGTGAP